MLDMLLMMQSKWLFEWGQSAIHDFLNDFMGRNKISGKITYLDNKLHQ